MAGRRLTSAASHPYMLASSADNQGRTSRGRRAALSIAGQIDDETDLPAKRVEAEAQAWLSRAHGDKTGPAGSRPPQGEGAEDADGVEPAAKGAPLQLETLKHRSEFDRLRHGRKWVAVSFILQGAPREGASATGPRFGFVVGAKALKESGAGKGAERPGAVMRNRARRRLKEAVRLLAETHARPDFDYVIIGRWESLHQRFADLLEELQLAFGKVNRPPRANDGTPRPGRQRKAQVTENQGPLGTIADETPNPPSATAEQAGRPSRVIANDGRK